MNITELEKKIDTFQTLDVLDFTVEGRTQRYLLIAKIEKSHLL